MGGSGEAAVHTRRSRHPFAFDALRAAITGSKAVIVTAYDFDVMLLCLAKRISPVPSIRSVGNRNAHDCSK